MARPKGIKNKKSAQSANPMVEEILEIEVEYVCPKRGKVKEKVKMKRLKPIKVDMQYVVGAKDDMKEINEDDGLSIYEGTEDGEE